MTEEQVFDTLAIIKAAYPDLYAWSCDADKLAGVKLWADMFSSDSADDVIQAVRSYIATEPKPPRIADIKNKLAMLRAGPGGEMTEQEAWTLVNKALRNGIYGYEKEFAALPEVIQRCIGSSIMLHEWAQMDIETTNSVVSSNFMRSYRARAEHVREMEKLPPDVKALFGAVGEAMKLPEMQPRAPIAALEPGEPVEPPDWWKEARKKFEAASLASQNEQKSKRFSELMGGEVSV